MAKVELKQPIVEEISSVIDGAQSGVLVDHRGLTVQQDTALRKQLREAGVSYKVYKNTMMRFAFKGTAFEGLSDLEKDHKTPVPRFAYPTSDAAFDAACQALKALL